MAKIKKNILFILLLIAVLFLIPSICNAANTNVSDEQTLRDTIQKAEDGSVITLTDNITINDHLDVTKNVTIKGAGFSISASDEWYTKRTSQGKRLSGNQALITSTAGTLTLENITLKHSQKQGAQAYGNGTLVLDGVTIEDCDYSGLIANGGTIKIKKLNLRTVAGIEVGKASGVQTTPKIVMDGTISSTSNTVIYMDPSTPSDLDLENTPTTTNKIYANKNSVVITDNNNNVIYVSSEINGTVTNDNEEEDFIVTINYNGKTKKVIVKSGDTLANLKLTDVKNIDGKEFDKFVDENQEPFSEETPITKNIVLTAVYKTIETSGESIDSTKKKGEKDDTPKTGVENTTIIIASTVAIIALAGLVILKKK